MEARRRLELVLGTGIMSTAAGLLRRLGWAKPRPVRAEPEQQHAAEPQGDLHLAFSLTQAVNRATVVDEVYAPALDALLEALAVPRASILLFDPDGVMRFKAWRGLSDTYREAVEGHTPWSRDERDPIPILVEDVAADPSYEPYWPTFAKEGIRGLAFIPLVHQGALLGKFMVYSAPPRRFSGREVRIAQTVAAQVATAVARARLFESERRYAAEVATLYERERVAVAVRDQFIAIASHELKTPLTALKLNAGLLERYSDGCSPQAQATLGKLSSNVARLERLVLHLLDFSRLSSGKLSLERRTTDLVEIVSSAVQRAQAELTRSGSPLELDGDPSVVGSWDPERLDQLVTNLLHNAIKYGEGRPITLGVRADTTRAVLEVRDRGIGIAPADQARVFERFERAVSVQHFGGFGLGLWIARAVVEAHEGTISLTSAPGEGATFRVELPLQPAA